MMNMFRGSRPIPSPPWLFGAIALFGLTSCTTTRLAAPSSLLGAASKTLLA